MILRVILCWMAIGLGLALVGCGGGEAEQPEGEGKPLYEDPLTGDTTGMPADYEKQMKPLPGQGGQGQP